MHTGLAQEPSTARSPRGCLGVLKVAPCTCHVFSAFTSCDALSALFLSAVYLAYFRQGFLYSVSWPELTSQVTSHVRSSRWPHTCGPPAFGSRVPGYRHVACARRHWCLHGYAGWWVFACLLPTSLASAFWQVSDVEILFLNIAALKAASLLLLLWRDACQISYCSDAGFPWEWWGVI